jgi:hypothetical protein
MDGGSCVQSTLLLRENSMKYSPAKDVSARNERLYYSLASGDLGEMISHAEELEQLKVPLTAAFLQVHLTPIASPGSGCPLLLGFGLVFVKVRRST